MAGNNDTSSLEGLEGLGQLIQASFQLQKMNRVSIAANVFLFWDICLTLEREIDLIWRSQWSLPKILYLATRYLGLFNITLYNFISLDPDPSVGFCNFWKYYLASSGTWFFATTVNLIFLLRLRALFNQSEKVTGLLYIMYLTSTISTLIPGILTVSTSIHMAPKPIEIQKLIPGCYASGSPGKIVILAWVPSIFLACIFFLLTVYRFLDVFRDEHGKVVFSKIRHGSVAPLMTSFVRDGVIFFIITFAVSLTTALYDVGISSNINREGPQPWYMATYAMSGSRLILHIRELSLTECIARSEVEMSTLPAVILRGRHNGSYDDINNGKVTLDQENAENMGHEIGL